jgi:peptidoglycan-N-acetylglucosamine deacetylase
MGDSGTFNMRSIASLSLDLDNKWSYMKTHGDAGWESFPSYLDIVVPRALEFFKARDIHLTFFVVGQDAALPQNHESLNSIADAGHEIGNHSFNHEPWLHLYSKAELIREFERSEESIVRATGVRPVGFRGPGFSLSSTVLEVLADRNYLYDCSTLPTFIGPLARAYYFLRSPEMSAEEREKRKKLFGNFSEGFQSLQPFVRSVGSREIVEIPVTTMPILKTPIHVSYLIYLSTFSITLARAYWKTALSLCAAGGIELSLLIHPLDILCSDDAPELKFFPGMNLPLLKKMAFLDWVMSTLKQQYEVVNMQTHALSVSNRQPSTASQLEALQ